MQNKNVKYDAEHYVTRRKRENSYFRIVNICLTKNGGKQDRLRYTAGNGINEGSMFRRLKQLYQQYKPYVRVDLVMYAVLLLLIVMYFIYSLVVD